MISIIVPAYNHAKGLPLLFDSIQAQTFTDWEVTVVDDGSTDDTTAVVQSYQGAHDLGTRLRYIRQQNAGAPAARNLGASEARGEYLLFADADLVFVPNALADMHSALEANPAASFAYGSFRSDWKLMHAQTFDVAALRRRNYIHTSALIRREAFPGFDESLSRFQDWDLWLAMVNEGRTGIFVDKVLFQTKTLRRGISAWRPRAWYRVCALVKRVTGWEPYEYRRYRIGVERIKEKYGITE